MGADLGILPVGQEEGCGMTALEEYVRALAALLTPAQRECLAVLSRAEIARRRFGEDEFDRTVDAEMGLETWEAMTATISRDPFFRNHERLPGSGDRDRGDEALSDVTPPLSPRPARAPGREKGRRLDCSAHHGRPESPAPRGSRRLGYFAPRSARPVPSGVGKRKSRQRRPRGADAA